MVNMYGASRAHHLLFARSSTATQWSRGRQSHSSYGSLYGSGFREKSYVPPDPPRYECNDALFSGGPWGVLGTITGILSGLVGGGTACNMYPGTYSMCGGGASSLAAGAQAQAISPQIVSDIQSQQSKATLNSGASSKPDAITKQNALQQQKISQQTEVSKQSQGAQQPQNDYGISRGWSSATAEGFALYNGPMTVHDDVRGSRGDIKRNTFTVSDDKDSSGFPKTISIGPYSYKFERVENGVAIYSSITGAGDEYRLQKNSDGTYALNQYKGDKGAGQADISSR